MYVVLRLSVVPSMSAVSVRVVQNTEAGSGSSDGSEASSTWLDTLPFSSGNPRVERICGVVHLYRPTPAQTEAPGAGGGPTHPPTLPVTDTVCALGVPGGLSVADFCAFVGAMLPRVKDMRIVRDERDVSAPTQTSEGGAGNETPAFTYAVIMRFDVPGSAEEFFRFYHGRAVR